MSGPRLTVDLDAILANWRALDYRAAPATAAAVVKANAYGLGAVQAAGALAKAGCKRFYVAWPNEGVELRNALGAGAEIAVFHGPTSESAPLFGQYDLQPVLNSLDQIALWKAQGDAGRSVALHLDTGINRLGVDERDWPEAQRLLPAPTWLVSHLASPDLPENGSNQRQLMGFERAISRWPKARRSLASTAAIYLGSRYHFDEVRPGIGLYGGGPRPPDGDPLRPVVTLTAPVIQVRHIGEGENVGYGGTWTSADQRTIATIGLGYADGFLRAASNRGNAFVAGEKRPILGRVSMDLIVVDVTGLNVAPGDEIEFLGPNLPLSEAAASMGTIDYELLTRLGPRLERTWSGGG